MTRACTVILMSPSRKWAATDTPEARREILAAIKVMAQRRKAVDDAREARDELLRKHYAAGVDVRDLVQIVGVGGLRISSGHMFRIVSGARTEPD